jgi:hypothetical protein
VGAVETERFLFKSKEQQLAKIKEMFGSSNRYRTVQMMVEKQDHDS